MGTFASKYDWDFWRTKYVSSDCTLAELAATEGAPSLIAIRKKSGQEDWPRQRLEFRRQVTLKVADGLVDSTAEKIREDFAFDTAEMLARHNQLANALISTAVKGLQSLAQRGEAPTYRDCVALAKLGIDTQRLIAGQATEIKAGSEAPPSVIILPAKGGE